MKIEDKLVASVISGLKALYGQEVPEKMVQMQKTKKEFEGHLTLDRKSTRLNSSHSGQSRMPSSA